jgi:hypothetical protein
MQLKTRKRIILLALLILNCTAGRGQFLDAASGLLQMPSADMGPTGTVMFTCNFLNRHSTPPAWPYNTFNYGPSIVILPRIEIGYVLTYIYLENHPAFAGNGKSVFVTLINQDRHFYAKLQLLREGEFGQSWIPALAVGVSDPTTGDPNEYTGIDYTDFDVSSGNGYFNRYYAVATKHFTTPYGVLGAHLGYQFSQRIDYTLNGPCAAIDWEPVWLQKQNVITTKLIAEYDARTFNIGFVASLWKDHIEIMAELQALKWFSGGIRFKTVLF